VSPPRNPAAIAVALLPAGSLVAFPALTVLSTVAVRDMAANLDFLVQRRLVVVIAATGLVVSFAAYGVSCAAAFRTLNRLEQLRATRPALNPCRHRDGDRSPGSHRPALASIGGPVPEPDGASTSAAFS
jgi:hypothetical protein